MLGIVSARVRVSRGALFPSTPGLNFEDGQKRESLAHSRALLIVELVTYQQKEQRGCSRELDRDPPSG